MSSSVLHDRIPFSCIYPDEPTFFFVLRVFGSTCFIQNLQPGLDKLESKSIKCVFVVIHELRNMCFDPVYCKFYTFTDVTFFK